MSDYDRNATAVREPAGATVRDDASHPPPPWPAPPQRSPGVPLWVAAVLILPVVAATVGLGAYRWQRERAQQSEAAAIQATFTAAEATRAATPPTPAPQPTATPVAPDSGVVLLDGLAVGDPVREEVLDAVDMYWRVVGDAIYYLDTSGLPGVAADQELKELDQRIERLRAENVAFYPIISFPTSTAYRVRAPDADLGVRVKYKDRSYYIDAKTKEPVVRPGSRPSTQEEIARGLDKDAFLLVRKVDGTWKVVRSFDIANVTTVP